jgi:glycosyltransferase involved in cell wall biosynthesis
MSDVEQECLVSILLPAYNSGHLIGNAIKSVLNQTQRRFELIVINDCSIDDTAEVVARFACSDSRIKLLHMKRNSGPAAARNVGFDAARGRWIALLDSDDAYVPERLTRLLELADANAADMVSDNLLMLPAGGTPYLLIPRDLVDCPQHLTAAEFIYRNIGDPNNPRLSYGFMQPMIRRDFLLDHDLRYDERNRFGEDFMLYIACLRAGARWWITPEVLYHYATRPGSLTEVQTSGDLWRIAQLEEAFLRDPAVLQDPALCDALRQHKAKIDRSYYYRAFTDAIKTGRFGEAGRLLIQSPSSSGYIALETVRQMPIILRKTLRGGYFPGAGRTA